MATNRTKLIRKAAKAGRIPHQASRKAMARDKVSAEAPLNVGRDFARTLQLVNEAKTLRPPSRRAHPHRGARLSYNVVGGNFNGSRPDLTEQELIDLHKALGTTPGDTVRQAYGRALASYTAQSEELSNLTPKKVLDRLSAVLTHGQGLLEALKDLKITDKYYIGSFWRARFLAGQTTTDDKDFTRGLYLYLVLCCQH